MHLENASCLFPRLSSLYLKKRLSRREIIVVNGLERHEIQADVVLSRGADSRRWRRRLVATMRLAFNSS
jgi:hypothetical protein